MGLAAGVVAERGGKMLGMNLQVLEFERAYEALFKEYYDNPQARLAGNRYLYALGEMTKLITVQQKKVWRRFP